MSIEEIPFERVLAEIKAQEARSRRFAQFATIGPIVAATILLAYSVRRVSQSETETEYQAQRAKQFQVQAEDAKTVAADYQHKIEMLSKELIETKEKLERVEDALASALDLKRFSHPVDMMDVKHIYGLFPPAARLLEHIFELKNTNVRWHLNGRSPDVGFDSPHFAAYILKSAGWRGELRGFDLASTSEALRNSLDKVREPRPGDLLFYPTGYAMFYFEDHTGSPYVIGMTPFGISALRPDFGQPLGIYRANLKD